MIQLDAVSRQFAGTRRVTALDAVSQLRPAVSVRRLSATFSRGALTSGPDEYVLYVMQVERQTGQWRLVGGYAGEVVTVRRAASTFAPDRGLTRPTSRARRTRSTRIGAQRWRRPCAKTDTARTRRGNTRRRGDSIGARRWQPSSSPAAATISSASTAGILTRAVTLRYSF
jgi:hypothetical protein